MGLFGKLKPPRLAPVHRATKPAVDVIFVHGLDGDPIATWRFESAAESWHSWIGAAVPEANIWSLGYGLRLSRWFGGSMPLSDRAINILATIDVELTDDRPLVFICHSYGGLLVKQLLRTAGEAASEYHRLAERTAGIVFLGTPHTGSAIAGYSLAMRRLLRSSTAVRELGRNAALLRDLNRWFRDSMQQRPRAVRVYFETQATRGVRVVDEASSDPGLVGVTPVPVDADHLTLCRPLDPDFRVKQTIVLIRSIIGAPSPEKPTLIAEILTAPEDRLPFIEAKVRRILAIRPGDWDALAARMLLRRMERHHKMHSSRLRERRSYDLRMEDGWLPQARIRRPFSGRPLLWATGLVSLAALAWKPETLVALLALSSDLLKALVGWFS